MSYADGISVYPGAIDTRTNPPTGENVTQENQRWVQDAPIKIQETLGVDPQGGSGSVADRLNTGTFPALNIAGDAQLQTLTTADIARFFEARVESTSPKFTLSDTDAATPVSYLGFVEFEGQGGTQFYTIGNTSLINDRLDVFNRVDGSITRLFNTGNGYVEVGSPASQATPANGDLNAVRLFSNGTLVTCYPLEMAYGTFIPADWDALVPDDVEVDEEGTETRRTPRQHDPAHAFAARTDLDLDDFCARLKARKALPNFPAKDEWPANGKIELGEGIQKLIEAVEVQAVHIAQLHERNTELEARLTALENAS